MRCRGACALLGEIGPGGVEPGGVPGAGGLVPEGVPGAGSPAAAPGAPGSPDAGVAGPCAATQPMPSPTFDSTLPMCSEYFPPVFSSTQRAALPRVPLMVSSFSDTFWLTVSRRSEAVCLP